MAIRSLRETTIPDADTREQEMLATAAYVTELAARYAAGEPVRADEDLSAGTENTLNAVAAGTLAYSPTTVAAVTDALAAWFAAKQA